MDADNDDDGRETKERMRDGGQRTEANLSPRSRTRTNKHIARGRDREKRAKQGDIII